MASMIVSASEFQPSAHLIYTGSKPTSKGGRSIGMLNSKTKKAIYLNLPLLMTYGAVEKKYEDSSNVSYELSIQFPRDEFATDETRKIVKMFTEMEDKIIEDSLVKARDWFGRPFANKDVALALWNPILKYPLDESKQPDKTRPPTLKIKLPYYKDKFGIELYDDKNNQLIPNEDGTSPTSLIDKGANFACIIQCGGMYFAGGKFGVTWRLHQGVVQAPERLVKGKCYVMMPNTEEQEEDAHRKPTSTVTVSEAVYDSDGEGTPEPVSAPETVVSASEPVAESDTGKEAKGGFKKKAVKK